MNPLQPGLISAAIQRMSEEAEIIIATDNDSGGDEIAAQLEEIASQCGRAVRRDQPSQPGADWNDVLRGDQPSPYSR